MMFGLVGFIMLPITVNLTKQAIHRCAKCLNEVKTNSFFGFSSMEDNLVTFQVGKMGIVLTRRLLLYVALIVTAILAIYSVIWVESTHNHDIGKFFNHLFRIQLRFQKLRGSNSEVRWDTLCGIKICNVPNKFLEQNSRIKVCSGMVMLSG